MLRLRAEGLGVAAIAKRLGTTVAIVRRVVGTIDPAEKRLRRSQLDKAARRIDAGPGDWPAKVKIWTAETGLGEASLWRVLKRIGLR